MSHRSRFARVAFVAALALTTFAGAHAQGYPSKPVRVIVPFTPGGMLAHRTRQVLRHHAREHVGNAPQLPDVPAVAETLKGFDIVLWNGIMGPPGMSRDLVNRLNRELARMLTLPSIKDAWAKQGAEPVTMTPEEVTEHLKADIQKLGRMVRASGAKVD